MQQEMEYIYQVYLERNFSKAAEKLYISQPALSMAVKKVEDQIGMPIFDRSARPLTLTAAGEAYIAHIRESGYLEAELKQQLQDIKCAETGHICLGGSHYLNAYILPEVIAEFSEKHQGIEIELFEASSAVLAGLLAERKLDLTFNCNPNFMMDFERYPAFTDHVLLTIPHRIAVERKLDQYELTADDIAQGRHLAEDCPRISLNSLKDMDFIILSKGNNLRDRSLKMFEEAGFEPRIRMELSQLVTAYHLAAAGIGATFVSDRLVNANNPELCYFKLNSEHTTRQFYTLLPTRKYTSVAVCTFIRFFTEYMNRKENG